VVVLSPVLFSEIINSFMYKENRMDELFGAYLAVYEANKWEKESGIGGKSPEAELARMRSRAFHTGGVKPKTSVNPSDIPAGTVRMNRGVARMVHARNRGKSPSDPTYSHRKKIDPLKTPSYRESPLGLPKGYKDPLNRDPRKKSPGDKIKSPVKSLPKETSVNAKNKIIKFQREELEYILDILVSEGYVCDYESATRILEAMSDEWLVEILEKNDELQKRAEANKKALDTGFMKLSPKDYEKEKKRIENIPPR